MGVISTKCSDHNNNPSTCRSATENSAQCYFYYAATPFTDTGVCSTYADATCTTHTNGIECAKYPGCTFAEDACTGTPRAGNTPCFGKYPDTTHYICLCGPAEGTLARGECAKACPYYGATAKACRAATVGNQACVPYKIDTDYMPVAGITTACLAPDAGTCELAPLIVTICEGAVGCHSVGNTCVGPWDQVTHRAPLTVGVIVGISIGGIVFLGIVVAGLVCCLRDSQQTYEYKQQTAARVPLTRIYHGTVGDIVPYTRVNSDEEVFG
jgi:hypothetical protein